MKTRIILWLLDFDFEYADDIIRQAFKGYHIAKIRKDAGKKKVRSKPPAGMMSMEK